MNKPLLALFGILSAVALSACDFEAPPFPPAFPRTVDLSASASSVTAAGQVALSADVFGGLGSTQAKVEFYDGSTKIGEDTLGSSLTSPDEFVYRFEQTVSLTSAQNGSRSYTARLLYRDRANRDASLTSAPVAVTVNIPN